MWDFPGLCEFGSVCVDQEIGAKVRYVTSDPMTQEGEKKP